MPAGPPRYRRVGGGRRRFDGRHAGPAVGRGRPGPGPTAVPARQPRLHRGGLDRVDHHAGARRDRGPELAGRGLLRRPGRRRAARGARPGPADRPPDLPLTGRARGAVRAHAAGRGGPAGRRQVRRAVLPGPPRRQARPPVRRGQLRDAVPHDARLRHRSRVRRRPGRPGPRSGVGERGNRGGRHRQRPAVPARRAGGAGRRHPRVRRPSGHLVAVRPRRVPHRGPAGGPAADRSARRRTRGRPADPTPAG